MPVALAIIDVVVGVVGSVVSFGFLWQVPRHYRRDVPRHVREEPMSRFPTLPKARQLTLTGRHRKALALGLLAAAPLIPFGIQALQPGAILDPERFALVSIVGIAIAVVVPSTVHMVFRRRLLAEGSTLAVMDSRGRFVPIESVVHEAPPEYGPDFRRLCRCCGYPTVVPEDQFGSCGLCDWSEDQESDLPTLAVAQRNFLLYRTVYGPETSLPWRPDGLSASELAARENDVRRFEEYRNAALGFDDPTLWEHQFSWGSG